MSRIHGLLSSLGLGTCEHGGGWHPRMQHCLNWQPLNRNTNTETRMASVKQTISAGSTIWLYGIPVKLADDAVIETSEGNWNAVQEAKYANAVAASKSRGNDGATNSAR